VAWELLQWPGGAGVGAVWLVGEHARGMITVGMCVSVLCCAARAVGGSHRQQHRALQQPPSFALHSPKPRHPFATIIAVAVSDLSALLMVDGHHRSAAALAQALYDLPQQLLEEQRELHGWQLGAAHQQVREGVHH